VAAPRPSPGSGAAGWRKAVGDRGSLPPVVAAGVAAVAIGRAVQAAATAAVARAEVWRWLRHGMRLAEGITVTPEQVRAFAAAEVERLRNELAAPACPEGTRAESEEVALGPELASALPPRPAGGSPEGLAR
jgi:hypothetical protein